MGADEMLRARNAELSGYEEFGVNKQLLEQQDRIFIVGAIIAAAIALVVIWYFFQVKMTSTPTAGNWISDADICGSPASSYERLVDWNMKCIENPFELYLD